MITDIVPETDRSSTTVFRKDADSPEGKVMPSFRVFVRDFETGGSWQGIYLYY